MLLGLAPTSHLGHVLAGEKTLDEIVVDGPHGVRVIPAGSGLRALTALAARSGTRLDRRAATRCRASSTSC